MKKSNSKLKIAVVIMAVALIAAVGGIFGVYAASQQNVKSSFSVSYSVGDNVAVKATTYLLDYNTASGIESLDEIYSVQYNVNDTKVIKSADGTVLEEVPEQNVTLSAEQRFIHFVYEIENLGENSVVIEINWSDYFSYLSEGATDNIKNCKFSVIDEEVAGESADIIDFADKYTGGWGVEACDYYHLQSDYSITLQGNQKYFVAVAIGVDDPNKDALCTSDETTGLEFTITDANIYAGTHN